MIHKGIFIIWFGPVSYPYSFSFLPDLYDRRVTFHSLHYDFVERPPGLSGPDPHGRPVHRKPQRSPSCPCTTCWPLHRAARRYYKQPQVLQSSYFFVCCFQHNAIHDFHAHYYVHVHDQAVTVHGLEQRQQRQQWQQWQQR
jgi:hypothetical protein